MQKSSIAVHTAARVAHNPYRAKIRRDILPNPPTFKTKTLSLIHKIVRLIKNTKALLVWKIPTANRTIRRSVKRVSFLQAKNKADPHLDKRVM